MQFTSPQLEQNNAFLSCSVCADFSQIDKNPLDGQRPPSHISPINGFYLTGSSSTPILLIFTFTTRSILSSHKIWLESPQQLHPTGCVKHLSVSIVSLQPPLKLISALKSAGLQSEENLHLIWKSNQANTEGQKITFCTTAFCFIAKLEGGGGEHKIYMDN